MNPLRNTVRAAATLTGILALVHPPPVTAPEDPALPSPVRVNTPRRLGAWQLPAERVAIGEGYKPSLALLPGGELVMVALFQEPRPGGKVREWTGLWRSADGGKTWSERA